LCKGAKNCVNKANEVGLIQADYAKRASELLEKARVNVGLSPEEQNELSILQVTTIQLEADRNIAIHNALMSGDSPEAKQLAINSLALVAGTSAAGIAAGIWKPRAKEPSTDTGAGNDSKQLSPQGYNVDPSKFDYFFGKVKTGNLYQVKLITMVLQ
jgi:filamentous hemagglutinin